MTWIKICGMTNLEDALAAVDAGADAVGFVFYEKSPRYVTAETAKKIVAKLPEHVETVGVFVGGSQPAEIALAASVDAMQCYIVIDPDPKPPSPPTPEFRKLREYLAVPYSSFVKGNLASSDNGLLPRLADAIFIDSGNTQTPGGTGKSFDWTQAAPALKTLAQHSRVVIAGGLTPENVSEAIEILKPWGVDVVSGVEARPGKKDPEKVRAFIKAVRDIDRTMS